jgi:hypothetical protein
VPKDRWPSHPDALDEVARHWAEPWGDRRQELVFIGAGMDRDAITAALDGCLVAERGFAPNLWADLADPFPVWARRVA